MDLPRAPLPRMARVRQQLPDEHLRRRRGRRPRGAGPGRLSSRIAPGQRVAITAGSRGIADIQTVIRTVAEELRAVGAEPFVVPAMGSHGGATVEGQRAVLAEYGITEAEVGAPILATMETVEVGTLDDGTPCYMDRHAWEGDAVVDRRAGQGPHRVPRRDRERPLQDAGDRPGEAARRRDEPRARPRRDDPGRGVGHPGHRQGRRSASGWSRTPTTSSTRSARPARTASTRPTASCSSLANSLLPRIPFDELDLLIVDELGKNVSGSGMDYNVVGMWRRIGGEKRPFFKRIAVLGITPQSEGNALGMGIADFTTRRLFDQLDLQKTYMNGLTANAYDAIKIPIVMASDLRGVRSRAQGRQHVRSRPASPGSRTRWSFRSCWCPRRCCRRSRRSPTLVVDGARLGAGNRRNWQLRPRRRARAARVRGRRGRQSGAPVGRRTLDRERARATGSSTSAARRGRIGGTRRLVVPVDGVGVVRAGVPPVDGFGGGGAVVCGVCARGVAGWMMIGRSPGGVVGFAPGGRRACRSVPDPVDGLIAGPGVPPLAGGAGVGRPGTGVATEPAGATAPRTIQPVTPL